MSEKIIINGNEVLILPPEFKCGKCGRTKLLFNYCESNRAMIICKQIQMRCQQCNTFFGNYKYDNRPQAEIRKEKINEWLKGRILRGKSE